MRNVNKVILSAPDNQNQSGSTIDASQLVMSSFQIYFGDTNAAGTFKLQMSNDLYDSRYLYPEAGFTVTNWTDVPSSSVAITSGTTAVLFLANMCYRWIRPVYTSTAAGVQTIQPIADTGFKQAQIVTAIADVAGSLNNTYFTISSVNLVSKAQKNFYVWYDNGTGVDPAIAGKTGVHITYSDNDTADTIALATRTAMALLTNDFTITGATNQIVITNKAAGPVPGAVDSAVPTGFTFGSVAPGIASNLINKYFFLSAGNNGVNYYVWMNPDSIGTDPAPAGKTPIPVVYSSGASAGTIGTAMAAAIAAIDSGSDFTATGTTTVTVTNLTTGPFVPASDFNTTFTIAQTGGGTSTITVQMNAMSV